MTEEQQAKKCSGCGIQLQTEDKQQSGYIPASSMDREPAICQRCFRIKHYNEASSITVHQDEFLKILGAIGDSNSLVVNIVDIFDFEGSLISGLRRFVGDNPIILVVNKIDLLPEVTNLNKIVNWVQRQCKEFGLQVKEIVMCSSKKNIGFDRAVEAIDNHRKGKDVYVVGATNVGKSTFINRLIHDYSDLNAELTTSRYPGTTLNLVKIPLDDGHYIIDTPGIVYDYRLSELVTREDLSTLMPENPLHPIVYQLNPKQTLFFGGLARFDFVEGERQSFTCYVSGAIKIHRTKLEKADELYEMHVGEMLTPPNLDGLAELPPLVKYPFQIRKGSKVDVLISGLGWIKLNSEVGAILDVHVPDGTKVIVRESLI